LNNIFGVDIDSQAVEVTKLSLLLKLMEGESQESAGMLFKFSDIKMLPDLSENIKCGNSLIGSDFYDSGQMNLFQDEETTRRINVFDWHKEFPDIFKSGGFDIVIGNPPWISLTGKFRNDILSKDELDYLIRTYNSNSYMPNLYENFIFKGLNLLKNKGAFSFIVPDRLAFNSQFIKLRKKILDKFKIISLDYKAKFPDIIADTLIFIIKNSKTKNYYNIKVGEFNKQKQEISNKFYLKNDGYCFTYSKNIKVDKVIRKIENQNCILLKDVFDSTSGFGGKSSKLTKIRESDKQIETIRGRNIERYYINGKYYFEFIKENITGRTTDKIKLGAKEKILLRKTGYPIYACYDESGIFPEQSLYFLYNKKSDISYLFYLGIINAKLFQFYYWNKLVTNRDSTPQLKKIHLDIFPFPNISNANPVSQKIISYVKEMLILYKKINNIKTEQDRKFYYQNIKTLDNNIDKLVYKLYGLTEDEIMIVEGSN
jgi:hypothetical protein